VVFANSPQAAWEGKWEFRNGFAQGTIEFFHLFESVSELIYGKG